MLPIAASLTDGLAIALFTALLGSLLAGVVGNRVSYRWDDRRRRRESDLAALSAFYRLYGEFFATWKLWNAHKRHDVHATSPGDRQWQLLERAEDAEAGFEGLLVKLASEHDLDARDLRLLGSFREAYQMLREKIRSDTALEWWASPGPSKSKRVGYRQYRAFKALSAFVANKLEHPQRKAHLEAGGNAAVTTLLEVTSSQRYRANWWKIAEQDLLP